MSRAILAIGAVVVVGVGIALWVMVRSSDATPQAVSPTTRASDDKAPATPEPSLSEGSPPTPRMRNDGDVVTHDHRTQARRTPDTEQPAKPEPPPPAPDVPSKLTFDVTRGVKKAVEECGSLVPASERTGPARMRGKIGVSVKSGVATIQTTDLDVTGATAAASDQARQCVAQKSMGLQTPAADQADIESYAIEVSFLIP